MLTEEQREKAKEALFVRSAIYDFEKKLAFWNHQEAVKMIDTYNLPYRVALDYIKGPKQEGFVKINPCYPLPGYYRDDLIRLKPYEYTLHDTSSPPNEDGSYSLCLTPINDDTRARIKDLCYNLRTWNLSTAAGRKKWEYEFAHFLNAADFDNYSCFDYWGSRTEPEGAAERINYWKCLQADYHMHPNNYRQEEPPYLSSYDTDYTLLEFIPIRDDNDNDGM